MDEAALDPDALADALGRRPDDLELRARAIDALRRRGHPGARLLELDARRYATPRAAPELVALDEEQRAVAAELDPTWIIRAGERDAERVDLVIRDPTSRLALGTPSHRAVFGVQLPRGSSLLALKPDARGLIVVERALRRADAVAALDALIEHSDPDTRQWCLEQRARTGEHPFAVAPQPSPAATALARLRWLVPQPWRWVVEQPSFNGAWRRRAPAGQRSPAPGPIVDDEVDVVLTSVGTERKAVLRELRGLLDGRPLRELATMLQDPAGYARVVDSRR